MKEVLVVFAVSVLVTILAVVLFWFVIFEWSQEMENQSQWAIIEQQTREIERIKAASRPLVEVTGPSSYIAVSREEVIVMEQAAESK